MTKKRELTNVADSIHERLLTLSRRQGIQYQEALQYFAMERFLYRLSRSNYARTFILKGALMLRVWQIPQSRLTRDIDLLGFTRMKDFYDLWQMSRHFTFSGEQLYAAITATFLQRRTDLPTDMPIAFTNDFIFDARKETQWKAFVRKTKLGEDAPAWSIAVQTIRDWLWPLLLSAQANTPININWQPNLGWR